MKNLKFKKIKGYIEGYYGKLLSWNEREEILKVLKKNKMNFYFYCPKEYLEHRILWKKPYNKSWLNKFSNFNKKAENLKLNILFGISPGLSFDFKSFLEGNQKDLNFLIKKIKLLMSNGAKHFCILFDDIPNDFYKKVPQVKEGIAHAKLVNQIIRNLNIPIFVVPRIYTDELVFENISYLDDFFEHADENIKVFYTGKNVVSENFGSKIQIINKMKKKNKIIYWDNFYANDYCPKRLIIGPWTNKKLIEKSMINGTGLVETDKLILEIVNKTALKKNQLSEWKKVLVKHKVPKNFFLICKPFLKPNFNYNKVAVPIKYNEMIYEILDQLLWKWKNSLSREWYPFLLNFKHDLQILDNTLPLNRILKTQTNPMQLVLLNRRKLK